MTQVLPAIKGLVSWTSAISLLCQIESTSPSGMLITAVDIIIFLIFNICNLSLVGSIVSVVFRKMWSLFQNETPPTKYMQNR